LIPFILSLSFSSWSIANSNLSVHIKSRIRPSCSLAEARSVENPKKELARYVSLEEASRLLGINQLNILTLVEKSLISGAEAPSAHNHHTWRFDKVALQSFLNSIVSKAGKRDRRGRDELHSFRTVLSLLTIQLSSGEGIHTLIEDIRHGVLTPTDKSGNKAGVAALNFDRNLQMKRGSLFYINSYR